MPSPKANTKQGTDMYVPSAEGKVEMSGTKEELVNNLGYQAQWKQVGMISGL
jgi:hypothetical protein